MPNQIKAKVVVWGIKEKLVGEEKDTETVIMHPVYGTGEENKNYSEATPCGLIELTITNKAAWGFFVKDKEYFVDFTPA